MPFALLKSRPCMDRCEPWVSSNKRTGFSLEHLVCLTKCFKNSRKCDSFIHPDGLADPELPGGAHLRKWKGEKRWNYIASCWDSNSYCSYSKVFICYSVAIFISPMLSFPPCTAASITDPHFTSCTRLTTYIYFLQHVNVRSTPCPPHLTHSHSSSVSQERLFSSTTPFPSHH